MQPDPLLQLHPGLLQSLVLGRMQGQGQMQQVEV